MKPSENLALTFGGFWIRELVVALPMDELREVLPLGKLTPIAAHSPLIAGGLELRGTLVPVIDPSPLLLTGCQDKALCCVVIVGSKGRLLGILASGVDCLFTVNEPELQAMACGGGELPMMRGSVYNPVSNRLVNILSAEKIMAMPQVPHAIEKKTAHKNTQGMLTGASIAADGEVPLLLMRSNNLSMAVRPSDIETTIPKVDLLPNAHCSGHYCGHVLHRAREIPAINLLDYLCLNKEQPEHTHIQPQQAFVLRYPQGKVAFLIDQITDIVRVNRRDIMPLPKLDQLKPDILRQIIRQQSIYPDQADDHNHYIIEPQGLLNDSRLAELARVVDQAETERSPACTDAALSNQQAGRTHSTLRVILLDIDNTPCAVSMQDVEEVLPYDAAQSLFGTQQALRGLVTHRQQAIPVVDLAQHLGKRAEQADSNHNLLLTTVGEQRVAFAVGHLSRIETARMSSRLLLLGAARPTVPDSQNAGQQLVEIVLDQQTALVPLIELQALARQFVQSALPPAESSGNSTCRSALVLGTPENNCRPTSTEGTA
ncbi:MAG TPA: chemotaxis protein CheW [Limnobacter sp.]|nr:chemotaxis protein CheW [Limnobacter sp.]